MALSTTRSIGDAKVSVLTDGAIAFPPDLFPGTNPARIQALLDAGGAAEIATNFNAVLIRSGGRTILADAGPRDLFGPACGNLPAALTDAGAAPGDVDLLVMTHLHPDHIAGAITPQGAAVFPNAELALTEAERAFWSDPARTNPVSESVAQWGGLARAVLAAYADRLRIVAPGGQIAPGLTHVPLPGHTPGHGGWRLDSGGASLVHAGDIVHAPALQVADPRIGIVFDMDADAARAHRIRVLDMVCTDGLTLTGGHFLNPAFHRLDRQGVGYRLLPA